MFKKIKQKFNKIVKKKHKGNVGDIIGSIICIFFMFVILTTCINATRLMSLKTNIDRVARKSMLTLETKGQLTPEEIAAMEAEVQALGFETVNITVNDGNTEKVLYGETVAIRIQGQTSGKYLHLFNSLTHTDGTSAWDKDYNYGVRYESISKASK